MYKRDKKVVREDFFGNAMASSVHGCGAQASLIELFFFRMQASYQPCVDKKSPEP